MSALFSLPLPLSSRWSISNFLLPIVGNSNNILYPKEDKERKVLLFACRNCYHQVPRSRLPFGFFVDVCAVVSPALASLARVSFPLYFRLFFHQHHSTVVIATLLRIYVFNLYQILIVLVEAIGFLFRKGSVRNEGGRSDLGLNIKAHEKLISVKANDWK